MEKAKRKIVGRGGCHHLRLADFRPRPLLVGKQSSVLSFQLSVLSFSAKIMPRRSQESGFGESGLAFRAL
jgi:hypothetical protein